MMNIWQCCGKNYSPGIKSCSVCKKDRATKTPPKTPQKPSASKETTKKRKPRKSHDPLISDDPNQFYVSTLKMKDGRTRKDMDNDRDT